MSFQGRWKQGSLFIVSMVMKFSKQIKLNNNLTRSKLVTEKIYNLINDMASDFSVFERIRQKIRIRRQRRESLVYVALRKYIHELVQTLDAIMPIFQMDSYFSIIYMMVTIVLLIINITYIPLSISFLDDYQSIYFNMIPQVMFSIWILIHSNTTIYKSREVITVRKEILQNYLQDSMLLEIMVVLPEYLRFLLGSYANVTLIFKIKLLINLLTKLSENIYLKQNIQNIIDITKSIMVLLYAQHLLGCTFHFIGQMEMIYYPDQPNWLDSFNLTDLTWIQRYVTSIYWSIITSLTVGYGDITPKSTIEQLFVAVISLVLCGALGMTITSIGDVFQQMNQKSQIYKEQMKAIELELKKRNLNHTLQIKVKRYYQQLFQLELANNQMGEQLMSKLNDQLQTEVKIDSYRGFLRKSFILKYFKDQTIDKLCTRVKIRKFAPGTEVIKSKTQAEELIILVDGQLKVQASDSQQSVTLKILNAPSVIAEQQFVQSNFYDSQINSVKYSTIAYINREDFYSVLREDQEELEKFFQIRDQCLFNINKQNLVGKICDICSWTHGYLKCPLAFLQVDQFKLVKRNQQSEHQKRAAIYNRRKFRANARMNKQLTQEQAVSAFSMFHNTLFNFQLSSDEDDEDEEYDSFETHQIESLKEVETKQQFQHQQSLVSKQRNQSFVYQQLGNISKELHFTTAAKEQQQLNPKESGSKTQLLDSDLKNQRQSVIIKEQFALKQDRQEPNTEVLNKILSKLTSLNRQNIDSRLSVHQLSEDQFDCKMDYKYYYPQFNLTNIVARLSKKQRKKKHDKTLFQSNIY